MLFEGPLYGIAPSAYQHPEDRAALAALSKVPHLDSIVTKVLGFGERLMRSELLGSGVRVGESQLPEVWAMHRDVYARLDIDGPVPELYLAQSPVANAFTFGSGRPIVVVNSELLQVLDKPTLLAVLAHEAGHVHCQHVLYGTVLRYLTRLGQFGLVRSGVPAGIALYPLVAALQQWSRSAEMSSDRAAALVTESPQSMCHALMALAAGAGVGRLDLDAFIDQAVEYDVDAGRIEKAARLQNLLLSHPLPVRRVRALLDWVHSGEYERILRGDYARSGDDRGFAGEAEQAAAAYALELENSLIESGVSLDDVDDWLDGETQ